MRSSTESKKERPPIDVVALVKRNNGTIVVNPLARFGATRIWRAVKKARNKGLVHVHRASAGEAIVTLPDTPTKGAAL